MSRDVYNVSGQAGAVGPKASAERNTFNQFVGGMDEGELAQLATELSQLRLTMRESAKSAEEDMAVAEVAQAEVAAAAGDTATVERHLAKAGKWALSTATAIGVALAAAAIKAAIGL
ncbi:hypothetical protein EV648_12523 [Kribbella sp. VKM Ac-2568]|nr:hypothetical protein EV648_12523 [Kribbella sp. VKM Ac-2568]